MDVVDVWRSQMEAGDRGDFESVMSHFDQNCEWRLVTSGKNYRGHHEVRNFIQGGMSASIVREKPAVVAEFGSGEWGVFEYVSRGRVGKDAQSFSREIESANFIARLGGFLFRLLFTGKTFEVPVCFIYHVNDKGLIDQVHEYAATHGRSRRQAAVKNDVQ